jgi:hypothetical protein
LIAAVVQEFGARCRQQRGLHRKSLIFLGFRNLS